MDPDLLDEWTTMPAVRDGACTAIAKAEEQDKDRPHRHALRYVVGLRQGWEQRKAELVAARLESASTD